jgi:hypothetical protein
MNEHRPSCASVPEHLIHAEEIGCRLLAGRFFGPNQWASSFGKFEPPPPIEVRQFPWDDSDLNTPCPFTPGHLIRETHVAFLGYSPLSGGRRLSIEQLGETFFHCFSKSGPHQASLIRRHDYACAATCTPRCSLMWAGPAQRDEPAPFSEQVQELPEAYETPSAVELVSLMLFFRALQRAGTRRNDELSFWSRDQYPGKYAHVSVRSGRNGRVSIYPTLSRGLGMHKTGVHKSRNTHAAIQLPGDSSPGSSPQ